mmetsp:Transcript_63757/g.122565  ORF Transcript_63757/g.122565 Transcript_63757/m.122565 type:complete len:183 (-) Transcript_63757:149-697(-)
MQTLDGWLLSVRFCAAALQLGLTASVSHAAGEHIVRAMSLDCAAQVRSLSGTCRVTPCIVASGRLTQVCLESWKELESTFSTELRLALALLTVELLGIVTGLEGPCNSVLNLFGVFFHATGSVGVLLFWQHDASCRAFHVIFVLCSLLPFTCELMAWRGLFSGARPVPRFGAPESVTDRMVA